MTYAPWTGEFEIVQIHGDEITPSLLIWRRYKRPVPGVLENFLDLNPHIIEGLAASPYLHLGEIVRIPIDSDVIAGAPKTMVQVSLFGSQ